MTDPAPSRTYECVPIDFSAKKAYSNRVEANGYGALSLPPHVTTDSLLGKVPSRCGLTSRRSPRQRTAAPGGHFAMNCTQCGKEITGRRNIRPAQHRFCSKACRGKWMTATCKPVTVPCTNCGTDIPTFKSRIKPGGFRFCSPWCKRSFHTDPKTIAARFWKFVDKSAGPDACWLWLGSLDHAGYGHFRVKSSGGHETLPAARVAYEIVNGEFDTGLWACHTCDNPPCVNPAHIFPGTPADNSADMAAKQRSAWGERAPKAKLNRYQVAEIRAAAARGESYKALAARFGVSDVNISSIVRRQTWRNIP